MTLVFVHKNAHPMYIALSTDISASKIAGASVKGGTVYLTDTDTWKIIESDNTLGNYLPAGVPLESNGGVPVNLQDQTSEPVNAIFSRQISSFSLEEDSPISTIDTLYYAFTAVTGHALAIGNEILLIDVVGDRSLQAVVTNVATDVITIDRPLDHIFPSATTLGRKTSSDLAVAGSLASPVIFSIRAGVSRIDITQIIITMLDNADMDDGKFGGMAALTNGLVLRIVNSHQTSVFNFKTNGDMKLFGLVDYSSKAPAGQYGLRSVFKFGGQNERGVVLRIATDDVIQWVVQDDLTPATGLISAKSSAIGHKVTD